MPPLLEATMVAVPAGPERSSRIFGVHGLGTAAAQMVVRGVDHDAVQPGAEQRLTLEGRQVAEGLDEGLLGDVGRIPGVAQRAERQVVGTPLVAPVEFRDGVGVAVEGAADKEGVRITHVQGDAQAVCRLLSGCIPLADPFILTVRAGASGSSISLRLW